MIPSPVLWTDPLRAADERRGQGGHGCADRLQAGPGRCRSGARSSSGSSANFPGTGRRRKPVYKGEQVLSAEPFEKRLTERAGFDAIQDRLAQPWPDLGALVSDVRARLGLDGVWADG
jgi:hypothetical protein